MVKLKHLQKWSGEEEQERESGSEWMIMEEDEDEYEYDGGYTDKEGMRKQFKGELR